jgi:hypothetical protein
LIPFSHIVKVELFGAAKKELIKALPSTHFVIYYYTTTPPSPSNYFLYCILLSLLCLSLSPSLPFCLLLLLLCPLLYLTLTRCFSYSLGNYVASHRGSMQLSAMDSNVKTLTLCFEDLPTCKLVYTYILVHYPSIYLFIF